MNSRSAVKEAKAKSTITPIRPNRKAMPIRITITHQALMRWFRLMTTGEGPLRQASSVPASVATASTPPMPRNR